jgi:hypothetical protein
LRFFFDETKEKCNQAKQIGGILNQEKELLQFELERIFLSLRSAFNEIIEK